MRLPPGIGHSDILHAVSWHCTSHIEHVEGVVYPVHLGRANDKGSRVGIISMNIVIHSLDTLELSYTVIYWVCY